ncbi:MAG: neutral/alkaline non-lysosomal ceramidase N-terminal domain-containing protein [Phycisphaerae bacterium]|nr:neutral/alkaline non-lysosomal ceramidase N-terminal domain-containing protein [Phycisphaerae bacterium]
MQVGASQVDITPEVGVELAGFAKRIQPSTGILDRLGARSLYLEQDGERLLWIHADLIGVDRPLVLAMRKWAGQRWGLESHQVMISATHTHSGPATIPIQEAGAYDTMYVDRLMTHMQQAAEAAVRAIEPCVVATVEGRLDLAVDRRKKATPHTDPRVAGLGFRRADGQYVAAITNYAMHAVALGPTNRLISADMPGRTAARLSQQLPGEPITLVTNGACGNLNPPFENVSAAQIEDWGGQIADAIADRFHNAEVADQPVFRTLSRVVPLPLDALDVDEIAAYAAHIANDPTSLAEWGERFRRAVDHWRRTMIAAVRTGKAQHTRDAELFAVRIGDLAMLGMNAEVFSRFTDDVRERTRRRLYVVGYANGDMGYIPTRPAYDEGGYEVEIAHLFYGNFRPKAGGLEYLAEQAAELVGDVFAV